MKRLLLLPILLMGLSFACDAPHEEVSGIKIGCPTAYLENFEEYVDLGVEIQGAKAFHLPVKEGFFDSYNVLVIDGVIEEVIFRKSEFPFDKDIMYELIQSLINRWGAVENLSSDDGFKEYYVFDLDSSESNMSLVLLSYSLGSEELDLVYKTKKQDLIAQQLKDEEKRQRSNQFDKL